MKTSVNRIQAIFVKDFKDLMKNMFISSSMIMPIILAFMYNRLAEHTLEFVVLVINLAFVVVAFLIQASIIAEEKEKNTLRGLMLSPASIFEIVSGKSLLSFMMTAITIAISISIMNYAPGNSFLIIGSIAISALFYITLGTTFGLLTNSVMQVSVVSLPIMMVFGFGNLLEGVAATYNVSFLIDYLPNMQLQTIMQKDMAGATLLDVLPHLFVIIGWFIAAAVLTVTVFKRKEMNE